ncbi:hypothetical protein MLD38_013398 [Melastoma candidum]|uniref:Uncharacterized protein n=1 Tax=Melastoma candidum TaxID=119954 RepID=A0ACB9R8V0_9MYRT|nr:hypothetical protein MLD38_013398 [Melastoma candidum]
MASSTVLPFHPPLAAETRRFSRARSILTRSLVVSASGRRIRLSSRVSATNFDFTPPLIDHDVSVGTLTSCTQARKSSWFGLGYIKREFVSEGISVLIGNHITGIVTEVPFLAKQCQPVTET